MSLTAKIEFLCEIDRLKGVHRASQLIDKSRKENSAEHSWHLAMYALVLSRHTELEIDLLRVFKMLLIHDVVEIDAGDLPLHTVVDRDTQLQKEIDAADRLFGILEEPLRGELRDLWLEFEEGKTNDARFAKSLDRLQPLIQNLCTEGGAWIAPQLTEQQVCQRYGPQIDKGSRQLWSYAKELVANHFSRR